MEAEKNKRSTSVVSASRLESRERESERGGRENPNSNALIRFLTVFLMSSLLVPSSSACCSRPCPSPLPLSSRSPSLSPFVSFPLQRRSRCRLRVRASRASESEGFASAGDSKAPNGTLPKSRRGILLEYVRNVQPEFMELFIKRAPQQVAENLAQLMYSVLMTGYMFKNAQYHVELQQSLEQVALPDAHDKKACSSSIKSTSLDHNLLVPKGSYALTAENCIQCSCNESNYQLSCHPTQGLNKSSCPVPKCICSSVIWPAKAANAVPVPIKATPMPLD